jgi:hypothetical protein
MRSTAMRALAIGLAVAALLSGCTGGSSPRRSSSGAPESQPSLEAASFDGVTVELATGTLRPSGVLRFGDTAQEGAVGSACWKQGPGVTGCFDTVQEIVIPSSYVKVPQGTLLRVVGDAREAEGLLGTVSGSDGNAELEPVARLDLTTGTAGLDVPPGEYTLEIDGTWDQGEAPLYFGVRIEVR